MVRSYDVSVIIPIYNIEEYLDDCLRSLFRQGDVRLQVIMVDDGSTDSSGEIADGYSSAYPYFECLHIENGGVGHARNIGVRHARGKYILFVDSDDILADSTIETMFRRAERDGSELTICNACHLDSQGTKDSRLHKKAFSSLEHITHIRENTDLLYDTACWNKLILRDYYEKQAFFCPEGIRYEDIPFAVPMHYFANQVSVVNSIGYYWRLREGKNKSITQQADTMVNLRDRIRALDMLDEFFDKNVSEENLYREKQIRAVSTDLKIFINKLCYMEKDKAIEFMTLINEYIDRAIDQETIDSLRVLDRQKYIYLRDMDYDALIKIINYRQYNYAPVTERDGRFYADLPADIFSIEEADITDELREREPVQLLNSLKFRKNELEINACIYNERVNTESAEDQQTAAYLYNEMTGARTELACTPVSAKALTDKAGLRTDMTRGLTSSYNYDGTGIRISVDLSELAKSDLHRGRNYILIKIKNRLVERTVMFAPGDSPLRSYDGKTRITDNKSVRIGCMEPGTLVLDIEDDPIVIEDMTTAGNRTIFKLNNGINDRIGSLLLDGEALGEDVCTLDDTGTISIVSDRIHDKDGVLSFTNTGRIYSRNRLAEIVNTGENGFAVSDTGDKGVRLIADEIWAAAASVSSDEGGFNITADVYFKGKDIPKRAVLYVDDDKSGRRVLAESEVRKPLLRKPSCSFRIDFSSEASREDLYARRCDLYIGFYQKDKELTASKLYCRTTVSTKAITFPGLSISLRRTDSLAMQLVVKSVWDKEQNSREKRRSLIAARYPEYLKKPLDKEAVLFDAGGAADRESSEWRLYEIIGEKYPEKKCVWALKDPLYPVGGIAQRVRKGSLEYYECVATCGYIVSAGKPDYYMERDGQQVIDAESFLLNLNNLQDLK